ncbi:UDP-4-amino-4,6-dideoxy-N-acetyl-beta-L-altrosamine transaminase [Leptospira sp. 201903070]|uniref:UDP-4-amino-4, 6-dideoxy-N-acetyl-beta-L-altrosamine transaminase n=1 Tax=Leptospira ainlahdjerensis TaxID=2810033 RepID=A0ABS2UCQ7_9LEPT|nr:UDP-4-amino-4,6-dideoxy-N-acetyl-beta-L-altrosamine transaminase [Leptospira ainlahdjerensis]MBM9577343.1 UDP-4-amino-4,6-dideoxy-N-acetyl-beta-L-altrosamine transaminase [Leptospira ainlahdjerensis]
MIPYGRQNISQEDIDAVVQVLKSDFLTQGPMVPRFESAVAKDCNVKHAIAVNSATSALHIACLSLGVEPGDIVWTSPNSFVASSNCALYCGATVDFIDIDSRTYNLSAAKLEEKLEKAEKDGKLPKVVIPVHFAGQPAEMEKIQKLSKKYGFKIIEDASHAIGGKYKGEPIGNCKYSDITVFSFHPVKIITTGEGGMCLTNDEELYVKMYRLRSHGITRDVAQMVNDPDGPWYYEQLELGFNYRMPDILAALGVSQHNRLHEFIEKRHSLVKRYDELLADKPVVIPWQHPDSYSAFHLYVVLLNLDELKHTQTQIFERFRNAGILANLHYIPIYRQPYYQKMGFKREDFPNTEDYYSKAITLPLYPGLTDSQQDEVVYRLMTPTGHQTLF